jgi:2-polyprenyl-3-methyl-5-hydroxy-6-metoxy-1,4-benzoquinol methylase
MFGQKIDYHFLRHFTHSDNIATEELLDAKGFSINLEESTKMLQRHIKLFEGHFPINSDLRYLEVGCGAANITLALAKIGCGHITAIDIVPRKIMSASKGVKQLGFEDRVEFICQDACEFVPCQRFDVVISFDALEHIKTPQQLIEKMHPWLVPEGLAVLSFGPLFHSPFGGHMAEFFRFQIPWCSTLFLEKAILRLKRECFRPTDPATRYEDVVGGLNRMRYSSFLSYVKQSGWDIRFLRVNPTWKRSPPFYFLSQLMIRLPIIRDYFAGTVYAILKPAQ